MSFEKLAGKFIVLDGPDGAGKSTQVQKLADQLNAQSIKAVIVRDPGGTNIGDQIRNILLSHDSEGMHATCEALLYMASRAQLWQEKIEPALAQGACVISDRWISSTIAYQAVAGRIGVEKILQIANASMERVWPDVTIIVDLPSDHGLQRAGEQLDRMESKGAEYHQKVRQAYLDLAKVQPGFSVINGSGTIDQVHDKVCEVVNGYVTA